MKKYFVLAIVIALLSLMPFAEAAVAVSKDGVYVGEATAIDVTRSINETFDGSTVTLLANGHKTGVTTNVSDESTLTAAALSYGVIALQAGSAKTIGLDDGALGQMVTIYCSVYDGGAITISKTAFPVTTHSTGWTTIQFTAQDQSVTLLWLDDTTGWIILGEPTAGVTFESVTVSGAVTAGTSVAATTTVTAGTTITAGTGITSTTGNIVSTAGTVTAGTTMTAGTGITSTAGDITAAAAASRVYFSTTVLANGHKAGVTTNVSDESNLTSAALAYGVINKTGLEVDGVYNVSLANGTPGQMVTIILTAVTSGSFVITDDSVAPSTMTKTGWDDITFNAALDSVTLLYVDDSIGWITIGGNSVTIT